MSQQARPTARDQAKRSRRTIFREAAARREGLRLDVPLSVTVRHSGANDRIVVTRETKAFKRWRSLFGRKPLEYQATKGPGAQANEWQAVHVTPDQAQGLTE